MPSRFNQLIEPNKYVSQYVPLPLDFINQQGAMKQKEHDATVSEIKAAKDLISVKADPHRYEDRDELLKSYTAEIDKLADDYIKSDNSADVANKLYKLKRSWSNDPIRMGLEASHDNYESYLKEKRENIKSGKSDFTIKGGYDTYAEDQTRDEEGNFKPFVHEGLWTAEDLDTKAKAVMGTIAKDGSDFQGASTNKDGSLALNENGSYWNIRSGGSGVKRSKAENLAIMKSDAFISDPKEGRYFIDKLLGQHVPYSQLDSKTKDYVQQEAAKYLYQSAAQQIGWETKSGSDLNWLPEDVRKSNEEAKKEAYETTFSQMGAQGVANLSEVEKAEPTNSLISKIFNFLNPNNQAKGILNIGKLIVPGLNAMPEIAKIEKELNESSNLSEDQINEKIEIVSAKIQQKIGQDDKAFRESFGFSNPMLSQTYKLVEMFGKGNKAESNADYERAKEVVSSKDPLFNRLTKQQQFNKVKEEMNKFVETSTTSVVLVPMDKKELDFKNQQLANVGGTPSEKTDQLINMGLTTNGKFVDFYTGKELSISDIANEGTGLKYMGELENDNKFGPGMNYFQSSDGKFYVSSGSLNKQKDNYINWNLQQTGNKFSKEHEFPLLFDDRRNINEDATIPEGVPKVSISQNLKTGMLNATVNLSKNDVIKLSGNNEDDIKIGLAKTLFDKKYTMEQIKQLGL